MKDDLRRSFELENQADLLAVAGRFGEARDIMREANRIHSWHFGKLDPNELRNRAREAIGATHEG